jgi:23S rRNA G2445 N2-methylase RlmL
LRPAFIALASFGTSGHGLDSGKYASAACTSSERGLTPLNSHASGRSKSLSSRSQAPAPTGKHPPLPYFATAAKGTEGLLRDELRGLGIRPLQGDRGGVHFGGDLGAAFRVCLQSRVAIRVLELRGSATVRNADELYQFVRSVSLDDVLTPLLSLAVSASVRSSQLTHSQFVAQRVKDAVVDRQRDQCSRRSNVELNNPDVRLYLHLAKDIATLYVDLAGESLHRRGYRLHESAAPLKESLAAALLFWSSWDRESPLIDPCCGSGTIAMEAAMMAANWAPGLQRTSFSLEHHVRINDTWREQFAEQRTLATAAIDRKRAELVSGSDIDVAAVSSAQEVAQELGLPLHFSRRDVLNLTPPTSTATLVTNPPYGIRLQGGESFVRRMADSLKHFTGCKLVVLSPDPTWRTALGIVPHREHTLFNGDIECRVYGWAL